VGTAAELDIFEEHLRNTTFISDNGSNMIKALKTYKRLPCIAHILNTVLKHTFDPKFLEPTLPSVSQCIKAAKGTVAYMKKTGLVVRLQSNTQ
jgi:hypothetical protein